MSRQRAYDRAVRGLVSQMKNSLRPVTPLPTPSITLETNTTSSYKRTNQARAAAANHTGESCVEEPVSRVVVGVAAAFGGAGFGLRLFGDLEDCVDQRVPQLVHGSVEEWGYWREAAADRSRVRPESAK